VRQALGVELPADYQWFVERYGAGKIDHFLMVLTPGHSNQYVDLLQQSRRQGEAITEIREQWPEYRPPFPAFPAPGGLIAWGISDNGDVCFWRTGDPDPDRWPVVVCDGRMWDWESYDQTMTGFLCQVLEAKVRPSVFPSDFPSPSPSFISLDRR
jgi:hypothetical protein